jgi:hypothetical protein
MFTQGHSLKCSGPLAATPLKDAVWRDPKNPETQQLEFHWSGRNTDDGRKKGADKLKSLLLEIRGQLPGFIQV